jgi:hypothetical protein
MVGVRAAFASVISVEGTAREPIGESGGDATQDEVQKGDGEARTTAVDV